MAEPPKPIRTKRLILREARKWDVDFIHQLYTNPDVMKYWAVPFKHRRQTEDYLKKMVESPNNGVLAFVIVVPPPPPSALLPPPASSPSSSNPTQTQTQTPTKSTHHPNPIPAAFDEGTLIGHAGIWIPTPENELVFMIDQPHWSQRFMTEVLDTLVPIFWEKRLEMVRADVEVDNEASVRLLRKFGFGQIGQNLVESYEGRCNVLRMELRNPEGGKEGGKGKERGDAS